MRRCGCIDEDWRKKCFCKLIIRPRNNNLFEIMPSFLRDKTTFNFLVILRLGWHPELLDHFILASQAMATEEMVMS